MVCGKYFLSNLAGVVLFLSISPLNSALAQTAPPLGTSRNFAVLGASTVTSTGASSLTGDVGLSPGTSVTGFPPGVLTGTIHAADAVAAQAQLDAHAAYTFLADETCTTDLTGTNLGGLTLTPGVYCFDMSAQLTGTLILDATADPNSVFVFKIGTTLTTASNSVVVVRGGLPCNVFFQVGSSATIGTGTLFLGNIFALDSITITTGATSTGGSYALNGAVTLDTNAVTACRGRIQVCKVAGSGVVEGTDFTFSVAGTPLTVPAGPAPPGSCSLALEMPAGPAIITETLPTGTTLSGVSTLPGVGLLIRSNLSAGTATVAVTPGGQTIVTFIDTIPPVIPATGFLQICKIAGSGVTVGTNFVFNVAGIPVTVPAGLAPGGSCSPAVVEPVGQALIVETLPAGTLLTNVATLPTAGLLVSDNLAAGTATVTVNPGVQTIVSFTDAVTPATGFLQVCKVAGAGVAVGTNFTFSVAGAPITVPAGLAPAGSCSTPLEELAGPAIVTEILPAGTTLAAVSTLPTGLVVSSNLAAGTATVTVNAGAQTTVTFQNTIILVPPTGFVQICKVAGAGVVVGTNFAFSVAGTPVTVPAGPAPGGSCSPPMVEPAGPTAIAETLPFGTTMTAISTLPNGLLVSGDLAAGTATVTVDNGGETIVTFIDTVPPVTPATGFLQICKVAGAGVAVGTNFVFNVAGTPVTVPAGPAPGGSCSSELVAPAGPAVIVETEPAGTTLSSVSTVPDGLLVSSNLTTGTATVTVNSGGQTRATFLNTVMAPSATTGFLQICKVAGAGVAIGANFTFTIDGTPVVVPAGAPPGGDCGPSLVEPAGATLISESPSGGATLTSVSTLPSGLLISSNPAAGTATVTVNAGGQTIATFLNAVIPPPPSQVKICKIAGAGVPAGGTFSFVVDGAGLTVPAGQCALAAGTFPTGTTVTVAETPSSGTIVSDISVVPTASQGVVNLSAGTATATLGAGVTEVDFTNTAGGLGLLKVCQIAGPGIIPLINSTFEIAGASFTVPAGFCVARGLFPVGTALTITELPSSTAAASAISVLPAAQQGLVDIADGSVTATIGVGVTEVYFTNVTK